MMRRTPSGASDRSFTSCRLVVAMNPLGRSRGSVVRCRAGSGGEQALVLALLPLDPLASVVARCEPGVDGAAEFRLAPQTTCEGELGELDAEAAAQLLQRPQPVQLRQAVGAVAGVGAAGGDEAVQLQVAQHRGRPAGLGRRGADGVEVLHLRYLTTSVSRLGR